MLQFLQKVGTTMDSPISNIPKFVLDILREWQQSKRTDQLILNFHNGTIGSVQYFKCKITNSKRAEEGGVRAISQKTV